MSATATDTSCPVSRRLQQYIADAAATPLPPDVAEKTKVHILDTLAAIVSGSRLRAGRLATSFAQTLGGHPEATVLGTGTVTSAMNAALANAMSAHADETDDSHLEGKFHPGCSILPAALAMAERNGASGAALTRAVALGYDVGARFTIALGFSGPRSGTHSTHCLGSNFGAAAAAGMLSGFDEKQAGYMISYAVQQASGIPYWQRDPDHVEKAFDFGGMGARNGVYAALMVEAGFTGVSDVLVGPHSYLSAFAENAQPQELVAELGSRYEIMRASIKKWSVGSPIQSALDAMTALIDAHGLTPGEVRTIIAHMPDDRLQIVDNRDMPDVCLQHALAATLIDGTMTFKAAHDVARMADPAVLEIRKRIVVVPSPELTKAKPERQSIVEIETADGRKLRHHAKAVRGTPDNPMTYDEVEAKAIDLMAPILGDATARTLALRVGAMEEIHNVQDLRPLLQP
ncbi:MAG: hypothetical protein RLZ98_2984 [Pseudomonadota bacterium]